MEMTTTTGITCPCCHEELEIETKGLFGGLLTQMVIGSLIERLKTKGGKVTCGKCKSEFEVTGK